MKYYNLHIIERVKELILYPDRAWNKIKDECLDLKTLYISYVMILAAIPEISNFIGINFIRVFILNHHIKIISYSFIIAIFSYLFSLINVYIISIVVNMLASSFNSKQNLINAFKLVSFSMTPYWISGVLYLIPVLSPFIILGIIYSLYLFYKGLPVLMETPNDKVFFYTLTVVIITIFINILIGSLIETIILGTRKL